MDKREINSMTLDELIAVMEILKEKPFRAKQIYEWLHKKLAVDFDEMTNLSKEFRDRLELVYNVTQCEIIKKYQSEKDNTTKYLFQLAKNTIIESVLMYYAYGNSVCISSQAGCRMGCKFCASTRNGLDRNLTAGEMLAQVYRIQKNVGDRISNVVIMGSGEPLDNYENVVRFIEILSSEKGLNIGQRHITLSTCGLVDKINRLADEGLQITLAVSLHGPNDEIRRQTMPIAKKYAMAELLAACRNYADKTGRRITYEYALIEGVNDSIEHGEMLADQLEGTLCHVNLIPVNSTENEYKSPTGESIDQFAIALKRKGVETTVRRKLGSGINAACGQLRSNYIDSN